MKNNKQEPWECPGCPSAQLAQVFKVAESFRKAEHAPSIRVDHFLLALVLDQSAATAEKVLKVFRKVKRDWQKSL